MTCTIAEVYRAEFDRHKKKLAEIDREAERRIVAGELTAEEQTAWLGLNETISAVARLRLDVHSGYMEPGKLQATGSTAGLTEQVEGAWLTHGVSSSTSSSGSAA
jgi:hypothetical protein